MKPTIIMTYLGKKAYVKSFLNRAEAAEAVLRLRDIYGRYGATLDIVEKFTPTDVEWPVMKKLLAERRKQAIALRNVPLRSAG